ncbi:MAG: DedA family protein, partial [Planctomycetota bacterium]|nr:DedA family protein [Planctomycetota bacterium]
MEEMNETKEKKSGKKERNPLKRLYLWTLSFAETKYAAWSLFIVAVIESIFFPVPPDAILVPLSIARPRRALLFCLICSVGSVLGGAIGYLIGYFLREPVAMPLLRFFNLTKAFEQISIEYGKHAALA